MTKPRTITISGPFDARHVGGVSIPGVTIPVPGLQRASTTPQLQPDETPSHTFTASGSTEVPRRSNTIASSLRQPSLRLKTSLGMLRGRSSSDAPDIHRAEDPGRSAERTVRRLHSESPAGSLRKKRSTSKLWTKKPSHDLPAKEHAPAQKDATSKQRGAIPLSRPLPLREASKQDAPTRHDDMPKPKEGSPLSRPLPFRAMSTEETSEPSIIPKPSIAERRDAWQQPASNQNVHHKSPYTYNPVPPPASELPPPLPKPKKTVTSVRPKRADSGVALWKHDARVSERPLGFREIISVASFEERMRLYEKTRDYWANKDYGLDEWTNSAGGRRPVRTRR